MIEFASDGRTVWVNKGVMLARFCPISQEFVDPGNPLGLGNGAFVDAVKHPEDGPTEENWTEFVNNVKRLYGVEVPARHKPLYFT